MKRIYYCPHCEAVLNPNVKIILAASFSGKKGLLLLSPQPGNYQVFTSEDFRPEEGTLVDFACPVCHRALNSTVDKSLAEIGFRTEGEEGRVDFSRITGEHATYFVTNEDIRSFGENAGVYGARNFFGS